MALDNTISKLADTDIRSLSSGQIITDVPSIVKELLENSLDSGATFIQLTLEGYGLDRITLKDNGRGIPEADRQLLACNHCTSKLKSFEDLTAIRTYGFRGEALHSLVEISQSFKITTRTTVDRIATTFELDSQARLSASGVSGDPVGTTVTITRPWYRIPVRRQKFRKEEKRITSRVKDLINTYWFVHPGMRFICTIKSATKGVQPVVISRTPKASSWEAFTMVFSSALLKFHETYQHTFNDVEITAILPHGTAGHSTSSVDGKTSFIYVDNRPLDCLRDVPKRISRLVKSAVSQFCTGVPHHLIYLNIVCPANSYDPNVEPNKSLVLWHDPAQILEAVSRLLATVYAKDYEGRNVVAVAPSDLSSKQTPAATPCSDVFTSPSNVVEQCPMSSRSVAGEQSSTDDCLATASSPKRKKSWRYSMFDDADEDVEDAILTCAGPREAMISASSERSSIPDVDDFVEPHTVSSTPWTKARLNARKHKSSLPVPGGDVDRCERSSSRLNQISSPSVNLNTQTQLGAQSTLQDCQQALPDGSSENTSQNTVATVVRHHVGLPYRQDREARSARRKAGIAHTPSRNKERPQFAQQSDAQNSIMAYLEPHSHAIGQHRNPKMRFAGLKAKCKLYPQSFSPPIVHEAEAMEIGQDNCSGSDDAPFSRSSKIPTKRTKIDRNLNTSLECGGRPEDQVHNVSLEVRTQSLLQTASSSDAETRLYVELGSTLHSLLSMRTVQKMADLQGGMDLFRAVDSIGYTLGLFVAQREGSGSRLSELSAEDYRHMKMTGQSDGFIRLC